ncbi:FAD-dependent oxidoreductase [Salibacterium halotolerans]|uniref:Glycine/D-amino acid oxidase n=1 Tax=Salibacterium halotolerans TaxID=1884432 RepID=A0A1I5QGF3_9BACI|nr:FAD-dependent oxidoreductase [Salibacterium halotolerans]SFP45394.1 Glycine/D-amino acid oxidase [Salibacterium halotolerans]
MSTQLPEHTESYWRETIDIPSFGKLEEDTAADVVVVGGGITGLTTASLLVKEGLDVVVLEADRLLNGTTGHTTAKITAQHGLIYDELIHHMGKTKARLYYESQNEALQFIKQNMEKQQISCDFHTETAYLYAESDQDARRLKKEYEACQTLHIPVDTLDTIPLPLQVKSALSMPEQARFHPLQYVKHLIQDIVKHGGRIYEDTTAVNIAREKHKESVRTENDCRVTVDSVVCCSHFPFYEGTGFYSGRMHADRSYVLAVQTGSPYPGGMYLSAGSPVRSLRSASMNGQEMVLIGGENHKSGQGRNTLEHYRALQQFAGSLFDKAEILYRWSAQDLTTMDKVPYIGEVTTSRPDVYIATGFNKWGMTNSTCAALLLKDLVLKKENPYSELYTPARFHADPSIKHFFKENMDVAKHLIKGKLEMPRASVKELESGDAAVFMADGQRKGAYRDKNGELYIVDTTCTHLGCEVEWNHGDRTWDCPCHGSRFSCTGEVIEGPAEKPLQKHSHTMLDNLTSENSGY